MNFKRKLFLLVTLVCWVNSEGIGDSVNEFTINLLATTSTTEGSPRNLALSPYTVWTLLSIIDEGAKGQTAAQMEAVLRIPDASSKTIFRRQFNNLSNILAEKENGVSLDIYNAMFTPADQKLNPRFVSVAQNQYKVNVQPTDFRDTLLASSTINKYVAQATKNRITKLIEPNDVVNAQLFVVSALHFEGKWMLPFKREETRSRPFYDENQKQIGEVDMMYQMAPFPYSRINDLKVDAIELFYGQDEKVSMIVLLPYIGQTVDKLLEQMKRYPFSNIIDGLINDREKYDGEDVKVYLPRFKVESDLTMNIVLQKMGITDVFDSQRADLLGMFEHYLFISRLIQRAEIEVNEEGTVASAVAGASIANKISPPKIELNRPFLYFIVNKPTKTIIFSGKVSVPPK